MVLRYKKLVFFAWYNSCVVICNQKMILSNLNAVWIDRKICDSFKMLYGINLFGFIKNLWPYFLCSNKLFTNFFSSMGLYWRESAPGRKFRQNLNLVFQWSSVSKLFNFCLHGYPNGVAQLLILVTRSERHYKLPPIPRDRIDIYTF